MEASCALLREFFFVRLVVTKGMTLSATTRMLLLTTEGMQNARLEGRALGSKNEGLLFGTKGMVLKPPHGLASSPPQGRLSAVHIDSLSAPRTYWEQTAQTGLRMCTEDRNGQR